MSADAPQATHNDLSQCLAQHSTEVAQIFDQRMAYSTMLFQNMQHDNAVKLLYSVDNMMVAQRNDMLKCVDKMINEASDKINQKMDATMQVAAATDKYLYTFKQLDKTSHKVLFEQQIEQTLRLRLSRALLWRERALAPIDAAVFARAVDGRLLHLLGQQNGAELGNSRRVPLSGRRQRRQCQRRGGFEREEQTWTPPRVTSTKGKTNFVPQANS